MKTTKKSRINRVLWRVLSVAYFLFFFSELFTISASAYIDPATTTMIIQVAAGVFITLGVMLGVFRRKVVLFFKNISVQMTQRKIERQALKQNGKDSDS